ncbi:thiazolylpeptide-type bacteriocin [Sphaerisporangium sp. NPDC051017]|uniref:thiazolylpeptide-type bacteriocin n=1 Tax=Sphaerisporangium sp. NPDC051017 TaxID=3154636 RepID=UPI0034229DC9
MSDLDRELIALESVTFEVDDIADLGRDAADWCSSSTSTSSCSSCSTSSCFDALSGMNAGDSACATRAALLRLPASPTCATEAVLPGLHRLSNPRAPFPPARRYLTRAG